MTKPIMFKDLPDGSLFRVFAEKRAYYEHGERKVGLVKTHNPRVYKKHGPGVSSTKEGTDIILALTDLVFPFEPRKSIPAKREGKSVTVKGNFVRH